MRNLIVIGTEFMRGSEGWALRSKITENIIFFGHPPPDNFSRSAHGVNIFIYVK